jgi:hypothetical protein
MIFSPFVPAAGLVRLLGLEENVCGCLAVLAWFGFIAAPFIFTFKVVPNAVTYNYMNQTTTIITNATTGSNLTTTGPSTIVASVVVSPDAQSTLQQHTAVFFSFCLVVIFLSVIQKIRGKDGNSIAIKSPSRFLRVSWPNLLALFSIVLDSLQLCSLALAVFNPSFASTTNNGTPAPTMAPSASSFPILQWLQMAAGQLLLAQANSFVPIFWTVVACVFYFFCLVSAPLVLEFFNLVEGGSILGRKSYWVQMSFFTETLYMTIIVNLIKPFQCTTPTAVLMAQTDVMCWTGPHQRMVWVAMLCLALYLLTANVMNAPDTDDQRRNTGRNQYYGDEEVMDQSSVDVASVLNTAAGTISLNMQDESLTNTGSRILEKFEESEDQDTLDLKYSPVYMSIINAGKVFMTCALLLFTNSPKAIAWIVLILCLVLGGLTAFYQRMTGQSLSCIASVTYLRFGSFLLPAYIAAVSVNQLNDPSSTADKGLVMVVGGAIIVVFSIIAALIARHRTQLDDQEKLDLSDVVTKVLGLETTLSEQKQLPIKWSQEIQENWRKALDGVKELRVVSRAVKQLEQHIRFAAVDFRFYSIRPLWLLGLTGTRQGNDLKLSAVAAAVDLFAAALKSSQRQYATEVAELTHLQQLLSDSFTHAAEASFFRLAAQSKSTLLRMLSHFRHEQDGVKVGHAIDSMGQSWMDDKQLLDWSTIEFAFGEARERGIILLTGDRSLRITHLGLVYVALAY